AGPGPRLRVAGPGLAARGGYMANRWSTLVDGPESARAAVRAIVAAGADLLKLFITSSRWTGPRTSHLSRTEIQAAIEEAHRLGRPVAAHCHGGEGLTWAL